MIEIKDKFNTPLIITPVSIHLTEVQQRILQNLWPEQFL